MIRLYTLLDSALSSDSKKLSESQVAGIDADIASILIKNSEWASDPIGFSEIVKIFKNPGYLRSFEALHDEFKKAMLSIPNVAEKGESYIDDFFLNTMPKSITFCVSYADLLREIFGANVALGVVKKAVIKEGNETVIPAFLKYGEDLLDDEQLKLSLSSRISPRYTDIDYAREAGLLGNNLPRLQNYIEQTIVEDYRISNWSHKYPPSIDGVKWLIKRIGVEKVLDLYDCMSTSESGVKDGAHISYMLDKWRKSNISNVYSAGLYEALCILNASRLKERYPNIGKRDIVALTDFKNDSTYLKTLAKAFPEHKKSLLTASLEM